MPTDSNLPATKSGLPPKCPNPQTTKWVCPALEQALCSCCNGHTQVPMGRWEDQFFWTDRRSASMSGGRVPRGRPLNRRLPASPAGHQGARASKVVPDWSAWVAAREQIFKAVIPSVPATGVRKNRATNHQPANKQPNSTISDAQEAPPLQHRFDIWSEKLASSWKPSGNSRALEGNPQSATHFGNPSVGPLLILVLSESGSA